MMDIPRSGPQPRMQLTQARTAREWSQSELAAHLETTPVNVSRWERGITRPSPYFRRKLCLFFGRTEQELDLANNDQALPERTPGALHDPLMPLPPAIHLVGRDEELARLRLRLCQGNEATLTALSGLPGVGKTALLITLAHDPDVRAHFTDGVLWVGLGPDPMLLSHLSRWGTLLGLTKSEMRALTSVEAWAVALRRKIGTRAMLLVIDDAWTLEQAQAFRVGGPNCVHLVSTRFPSLATQLAAHGATTIRELNSDKGLTLLHLLAPQAVEQEAQLARELVMAVGGLPLALTLIGNYLRMQSYSGQPRRITAALQKLSDANERLKIGEMRGPTEHHPSLLPGTPVSLNAVISVTDQQLDQETRSALYALALFPPRPNSFSEEAALAVAACSVETLDLLTDTGLLESSGHDRYSLHQTIADYARNQLSGSAAQARLTNYTTAFVEKHHKDYEVLEIESSNILTALDIAAGQEHPERFIRLTCAFAPYLLSRGLYSLAETHLRDVYTIAISQKDTHTLASTLLYLGKLTWKRGDYKQAEQSLHEGLEYARQSENQDRVCALLSELGSVTWKRGDYKQAEHYLQEGLSLADRLDYGERRCELLNILGSVERGRGNYAQSVEYLQQALTLARQIGEKELLCTILLNIGATTGEQGHHSQAEQYFKEGLLLARQLGHREWTSGLLNNLGGAALEQGQFEQANRYFQEGLEIARQIEHREWISHILLNLGLITRKLGDRSLSQQYMQESLTLAQQINVPQMTCYVFYEYGNLHLDLLEAEQAEKDFKAMLAIAPEGGQDLVALAEYGLARTFFMQGDSNKAKQFGKISATKLASIGHRDALEVKNWLSIFEG